MAPCRQTGLSLSHSAGAAGRRHRRARAPSARPGREHARARVRRLARPGAERLVRAPLRVWPSAVPRARARAPRHPRRAPSGPRPVPRRAGSRVRPRRRCRGRARSLDVGVGKRRPGPRSGSKPRGPGSKPATRRRSISSRAVGSRSGSRAPLGFAPNGEARGADSARALGAVGRRGGRVRRQAREVAARATRRPARASFVVPGSRSRGRIRAALQQRLERRPPPAPTHRSCSSPLGRAGEARRGRGARARRRAHPA